MQYASCLTMSGNGEGRAVLPAVAGCSLQQPIKLESVPATGFMIRAMDTSKTLGRSSTLITLFASSGTLICCALPILLVSLGLGSVVAAATFRWPFLVTLSEHSTLMFGGSAAFLALAGWVVYWRPQQCPSDPVLGAQCVRANLWNRRAWWLSIVIWLAGFSARFGLPLLTRWAG